MLSTLEGVVQRLISEYDPERIILFGSQVSEQAGAGSDIDLLIVKETNKRPIDRRVEVEHLLSDRLVPLDLLVYTPREVLELYAAGSPLLEEVIETGRVLYMRQPTVVWLGEAQEELESASILFDHRKFRGVCLHSQQCVEKGLKALTLEKGRKPARTHDIVELVNTVTADGWIVGMTMDDAVFLNSVYRGRYPTEEGLLPHGQPTEEDARRALHAAGNVLEHVRAALGKSV